MNIVGYGVLGTGLSAVLVLLARKITIDRRRANPPSLDVGTVKNVLKQSVNDRVAVTFTDGTTQIVDVSWVDDEGFGHSGPNGNGPAGFWSRFEEVAAIEAVSPNHR